MVNRSITLGQQPSKIGKQFQLLHINYYVMSAVVSTLPKVLNKIFNIFLLCSNCRILETELD